MFETPILLIIFNRPDTTRNVFETIRQQCPKYLYVAADGPRPNRIDDIEKCQAARTEIEIDWDCELHMLYRDENRGCGLGPAEAITWFFKNVEKGIILEDDSIPNPDFFNYCVELLDFYQDNEKVKVIGSANFINYDQNNIRSYHFSMQNGCFCSWATWRRTWNEYDYYLKKIDINDLKKSLRNYNVSNKEYIYWIDIFNQVKKDRYNDSCWDYQLMFSIWKSKGVGIVPNVNLATNVGFSSDATHTFNKDHPGANKQSESILPLFHPSKLIIHRKADLFYHDFYYQPPVKGYKRLILNVVIVNKLVKSLFNINKSWKNHFISLIHYVYFQLAQCKSQIKNNFIWKIQGRILRSKIIDYYGSLPKEEISAEENEVFNYLKNHKITLLPYEFVKKYKKNKTVVYWDSHWGLNYVLYDNKRLYYRKDWTKRKIRVYHSNLLAEQDDKSPHRYVNKDFDIESDNNLIDAGAAEGIFGLMNIEKVKKVYLIEPDPLWIEALHATFSPWITKTEIIEKFISLNNSNKSITIDSYFKNIIIDFIKIDVEGCEREVLKGSEDMLSRNCSIKVVIATYHQQDDEKELMAFLTNRGFKGSFSDGFVPYYYQTEFEQPYLRRCLIRAEKQLI